jgi:hypothetical protein
MKKLIISILLLCTISCEKESEIEQLPLPPSQLTELTQPNGLCGIWYGLGYQCNGSIPVEIIRIEHINDFVRATKITGDNCVEAGQITWQGYYYQSPFIANLTLGSSINPQSTITQDLIYIQNDSTITTQIGLEFIKLSLVEIEALNLNIDLEEICKPQS